MMDVRPVDFAKIIGFEGLSISLASPEEIKGWSFGEVVKPETINYRTLKPEKDGLFDERIFGPTKDWECYCGKYKRIRYRGIICDKCGVEVTQSKVRRERTGHITLASPIVHIWYFKGIPSKLSLLLDMAPRDLESVIYFASYLVLSVDEKKRKQVLAQLAKTLKGQLKVLSEDLHKRLRGIEEECGRKSKNVEIKIKDEEKRGLMIEEIELRSKREKAAAREAFAVEEVKTKELFKVLTSRVGQLKYLSLISEEEYAGLLEYGATEFIGVSMGAEVIYEVLKGLDLHKLSGQLREEIEGTKGQRRLKAIKRLKVVEGLRQVKLRPEWMVLTVLPVIPPDLRPMVQLTGGRFATSDLNDLYRRVINRNNRLKHLIDLGAPEVILRNEKRMLQEAVDALIDSTGRTKKSSRRRTRRELKSLSEILKGKQGRFRQNLLGKRVDYSGRSVIVPGPELELHQCGLPREMALEMFKPFVLRELILRGLAPNVKSAKNVLDRGPVEVYEILEEVIVGHPILLNRAPTLHKLGVQAFYPVLIDGKAIKVHPCVCPGFNADFDGDMMAIHVPLSKSAREEAATKMMAKNNLLKPADGAAITVPNKEMALGIYYLTSIETDSSSAEEQDKKTEKERVFGKEEAKAAFELGKIVLRKLIKVKIGDEMIETTVGRLIFNEAVPESLGFINEAVNNKKLQSLVSEALSRCSAEEVVVLIDKLKSLGFMGASISGVSVGIWDLDMVEEKEKMIAEATVRAAEFENNYEVGLITQEETRRLSNEVWMEYTDKLADLTWNAYKAENPVRIMVDSGGTRASRDQVKQLSAMRGLVVDPLGRTVPMPTKSNYRQGLPVFEYVTSARGARKGLADTALKTADAGYLTRRLVDVSHDVILRAKDCQTKEGWLIEKKGREKSFAKRLLGRVVFETVKAGKDVLIKKGEIIEEEVLKKILEKEVESVWVRSPLTCVLEYGICQKCYGIDVGTGRLVELGVPAGVIAAQSIGEPGTQLTMRTKHAGGILTLDVTQGLPRVEELFEARNPKVLSPIAEISGNVKILEGEDGYKIRISSIKVKPAEEREYKVALTQQLNVEDGERVEAGKQLASGFLSPGEVLRVSGLRAAQMYLVQEAQSVYEGQGISINDKHFEVIVRKMSDKVRVNEPGDVSFLPGELVDRVSFDEENEKVMAAGGEPATAEVTILGITRASLFTPSWLSAASFEQTTNILTDAALAGKVDYLRGLKENVIIGRLIPVFSGKEEV